MNTYKKIILFFVFLFLTNLGWGQDHRTPETLYLKDGSFLLGNLVEELEATYVWQLTDGTQITLPREQVRSIKEKNPNFRYLKNGKVKKTKGFSASVMAGGLFEKKLTEWSSVDHAASINVSLGYHINSKVSIGIGTGYDGYNTPMVPLYLDVRGDLLDRAVTPYYKISAGYGFAMPTEDQKSNTNFEHDGGILVHPSIGLKFYTRSNIAWLIDFGYRFQRYDQTIVWEISPRRWTLQRTALRVGIEF